MARSPAYAYYAGMETFPVPDPDLPEEPETADTQQEYGKQGDGLDVEFSSPYIHEPVQYSMPGGESLPRYVHAPFGRRSYDKGPVDPPGQGRRHTEGRGRIDARPEP